MPNVMAHSLMAQAVANQLNQDIINHAIGKYEDVFLFASSGPDFLFYYNMWPWSDTNEAKRVGAYGSLMHTQKINAYLDTMVKIALVQDKQAHRDMMIAFIAGYLCHWALDSVAHPFVFYRSGKLEGKARYDHFLYESNLDAKLILKVFKKPLSDHKAYQFMNMSAYHQKVVAFLVSHAHHKVYNSDISQADCLKSMKDARLMLKILYDPTGYKYDLVRILEKLVYDGEQPFSSHMVSKRITKNDELNLKHDIWFNPTDPSQPLKSSFMDLWNQSLGRAKLTLAALEKMLVGELDSLSSIILDRSFETDRSQGEAMEVFNSIYR